MNLLSLVPTLFVIWGAADTTSFDDYPKNPNIDIINYRFELDLSDEDDTLRAVATIDARFIAGGDSVLRLDLIGVSAERNGQGMRVATVSSGSGQLQFEHRDDQLFIHLGRSAGRGELVQLEVQYSGKAAAALRIGPNKHGDRTFFSDNWPNKARHWLPTVDHPYDKATSEMIVTAPAHYQVVSNGLLVETTNHGDNRKTTHWKQSVPIATWLYVIGVAEFAVQYRGQCVGVEVQTWVAHQDRDAGFHDFATPTCAALEYFSQWVGPYSYEKLANIVSPSVGGGMEAASAILYGERSVTGTRAVNWQNVIVHEVAHQWFGNAVTESDWNDVWLSEGFATYFTLLFREHARGRDDFVTGLKESRRRIVSFYRDRPDYQIVHDNLTDMSQVTTGMTYQKGAWVLHMLRELIGTDKFWEGIQSYYRNYQDQNATTTDFRRAMEQASGISLEAFFDQWLYQGGIPILTTTTSYDAEAGELSVRITQRGEARFDLAVEVEATLENGESERATVVLGESGNGRLRMALPSRPVRFVTDPDTKLLADLRGIEGAIGHGESQ